MSEKVKGFTVGLLGNVSEEEAKKIVQAIKMIKGVSSVTQINARAEDVIIEMRTKSEISQLLWEALQNYKK